MYVKTTSGGSTGSFSQDVAKNKAVAATDDSENIVKEEGKIMLTDATIPEPQNDKTSIANIKGIFKRDENISSSSSESEDDDGNIGSKQPNELHLRTESTSSAYSNDSDAQKRPTMLPEELSEDRIEKLDNDSKIFLESKDGVVEEMVTRESIVEKITGIFLSLIHI